MVTSKSTSWDVNITIGVYYSLCWLFYKIIDYWYFYVEKKLAKDIPFCAFVGEWSPSRVRRVEVHVPAINWFNKSSSNNNKTITPYYFEPYKTLNFKTKSISTNNSVLSKRKWSNLSNRKLIMIN